jgi:uncharacterized membrane protein
MGGAIELQDPLSFEAKYQLDQTWPLWKKIGYTTVNWIYTNRRGMMFGVLFGVVFLSEPLGPAFAIAAGLVGLGIVLVNLRR